MRRLATTAVSLALFLDGSEVGAASKTDGDGDPSAAAVVGILELSHFTGRKLEDIDCLAVSRFADRVDPLRLFLSEDELGKILGRLRGGLRGDIFSGRFQVARGIVEAAKRRGTEFANGGWEGDPEGKLPPVIWESQSRVRAENELTGRWKLFSRFKAEKGQALDQETVGVISARAKTLSGGEIRDMFLDSVAASFDRHSEYQRPYRKKTFSQALGLESTKSGIETEISGGGRVVIKSSDVEGVKPGDEVIEISGSEGAVQAGSLSEERLEEATGGGDGKEITIKVESGHGEREVKINPKPDPENSRRRAKAVIVRLGGATAGLVTMSSLYGGGAGGNAGRDFVRLVSRLVDMGVRVIVLDLRGNAGGGVLEACRAAGIFLGKRVVALGRDRDGVVHSFEGEGRKIFSGTVVCLVDAETGSAAEILAGALRHYGAGVIVGGGRTMGKGTAQAVVDLGEHGFSKRVRDEFLGAVKTSTMVLYLPDMNPLQGVGVFPDIVLPDGLEAARIIRDAKGQGEETEDGGDPGAGTVEVDDATRAAARNSASRTRGNEYFQRVKDADIAARRILAANTFGDDPPGGSRILRDLHALIQRGRENTMAAEVEDILGVGRGERRREGVDPYVGEAVLVGGEIEARRSLQTAGSDIH